MHSLEKEHWAQQATHQLEEALESRVTIEQAKGMLVAIHGISFDDAFTRLRSHARRHRRAIQSVAADVVQRRIIV